MKIELHIFATQRPMPVDVPIRKISIAAGRFIRGRDIELRYQDEYLQWRHVGEAEWTNLVLIASGSIEKALDLKIYSDNGNIFKNGDVATTLIALVTDGIDDISDRISPSAFSWEKKSSNAEMDQIFNETHHGYGRVLVVTPDDVYGRATYTCTVNF